MEEVNVRRSSQWAWGLILKVRIFERRSKWTAPGYAIRFERTSELKLPLKENPLCLCVARNEGWRT